MSIYMKIPGITGDVSTKGYEDWVELLSFSFSAKRHVSALPGRLVDREAAGPTISELNIAKLMDKTTPLLFSDAVVGKIKAEVNVVLTTSAEEPVSYMEYVLSNAMLSEYQVKHQGQDNASLPVEMLSISFDKIEMKYTPFNEQHKPQSPIAASYSLAEAALST